MTLTEESCTAPRAGSPENKKASRSPNNILPDISFLNLGNIDSQVTKYSLEADQFTFTVVGWDHWKWSAYAFAQSEKPIDDAEEEEEHDLDPDDALDAISGGADDGHPLQADQPFWNPRKYWLVIVEKYVKQVTGEWCKLMQLSEASFIHFVRIITPQSD